VCFLSDLVVFFPSLHDVSNFRGFHLSFSKIVLTTRIGLLALRRICEAPEIKVITLPLLDRFYGPYAYPSLFPSLFPFPGCVAPNARQTIQGPGVLNCTALGAEVQRCHASGRKVLLSVKADGLEAVGGNANFGDPVAPNFPTALYMVLRAVSAQMQMVMVAGREIS
jgi:hypothetical protein